jgi:uncharacterized integral membrane protein
MSQHSARSSAPRAEPSIPVEVPQLTESRGQKLLRHGHGVRLYTWAFMFIAALVVLIVLAAANVRSVKLDWVVGSTHASLVWIILAATVLGWLLGVATSVLFRFRTRRRLAQ